MKVCQLMLDLSVQNEGATKAGEVYWLRHCFEILLVRMWQLEFFTVKIKLFYCSSWPEVVAEVQTMSHSWLF